MELGMTPEQASLKKFFYGKGCEKCNNTGYKGRMGIYELLVMNDKLREMIVSEASLDDLPRGLPEVRACGPSASRA